VKTEKKIFRKGSTTYYFSSIFFPKKIKDDVFKLYSFVRVADDYVDTVPANKKAFLSLRKRWDAAHKDPKFNTSTKDTDSIDERVIKNIVFVVRKYKFDTAWVESFLDAMQADLDKRTYKTMNDTIWYMYGSAEVIGLMMAKIMGLPDKALEFAQLQGRAMQYINFIRDIQEDNTLARCYFPKTELDKFGLKDVSEETARTHPESFSQFMHAQLKYYDAWQAKADNGMEYIPKRLRVPLQTAVSMYNWTGETIRRNPSIVFAKKVKPQKRHVIWRAGTLILQ
jgi:phytoene synthase